MRNRARAGVHITSAVTVYLSVFRHTLHKCHTCKYCTIVVVTQPKRFGLLNSSSDTGTRQLPPCRAYANLLLLPLPPPSALTAAPAAVAAARYTAYVASSSMHAPTAYTSTL